MLPKTIDAALLNLRAQIVRDGGDGLAHVEALLAMRGCAIVPVPRKAAPPQFRRGELRRMIFAELRNGPVRGREIVARILAKRPHLGIVEGLQIIPMRRLVGVKLGAGRDTGADDGDALGLAAHHEGQRAAFALRGEMARRGVTYAQLAERLAAIGVDDNERNLRNKVSRGKFTAGFLLQCLSAMGASEIRI